MSSYACTGTPALLPQRTVPRPSGARMVLCLPRGLILRRAGSTPVRTGTLAGQFMMRTRIEGGQGRTGFFIICR
eukprot:7755873-Heterocapsa_arctica.AAC.1